MFVNSRVYVLLVGGDVFENAASVYLLSCVQSAFL